MSPEQEQTAGPARQRGDTQEPAQLQAAGDRRARTALSFLADPGDQGLGLLLRSIAPAEVLAAVSAGADGDAALLAAHPAVPGLRRGLQRWRARLGLLPTPARLAAWHEAGLRLLCPGDAEWPTQLDELGDARPLVLWARGSADLRYACLSSVSVVGARAATAYGQHVATELAAADGLTVAVLASGLSYGYPQGHHDLFAAVAAQGTLVSECPPDQAPMRPGFLIRNRIIAALSRGTVVVEAALRSGALNTAKHARELCRPLMAVPGPVTSEQSAGCHELIREWDAVLVTGAPDVAGLIYPAGSEPLGPRMGPAVPRDDLDPVMTAVLEAVPARGGRGPASIAITAGVDLDTALRCLGLLAAAGFVQRCEQGWRLRRSG